MGNPWEIRGKRVQNDAELPYIGVGGSGGGGGGGGGRQLGLGPGGSGSSTRGGGVGLKPQFWTQNSPQFGHSKAESTAISTVASSSAVLALQ